jgi:hypothetical protein
MTKSLFLFAVTFTLLYASCNTDAGNMTQMNVLKDSVLNHYPTVASVAINVQDNSMLVITLGDAELYKATAEQKQKIALELGQMALRIFGKQSRLEKGKLIVTQDERNDKAEPVDGIVTAINIDSLRKANNK